MEVVIAIGLRSILVDAIVPLGVGNTVGCVLE